MSNDKSLNAQSPQALREHQAQDKTHKDTPHEMLSYEQKKALLAQNPDVVFSFSLEDLRAKWPDPKDRVEVIRLWLSVEIRDCFWPDRQEAGLLMLDELIELSGFAVREK